MVSSRVVRTRQTYIFLAYSSIDKLPRTLQGATESIAKQTGWNVFLVAGGPNPRLGGKITTLA